MEEEGGEKLLHSLYSTGEKNNFDFEGKRGLDPLCKEGEGTSAAGSSGVVYESLFVSGIYGK